MKLKNNKKPLSLKNDYVFRSVFSDPNNLTGLADFLKSAIELPEDDYEDITVIDPHLLARHEGDKEGILDVRIRTKTGKQIDVEIQLYPKVAFRERVVYYNDRMYTDQLDKGQPYDMLGRAISIILADFRVFSEDEDYSHRFGFYDIVHGNRFTDAQEICVFELPKLPEASDGSVLWDWLELIKTEDADEMETLANKNPDLGKIVGRVMEMSEDEAERMIADAREKARRDKVAEIAYGRNEGIAEGLARGIEKGLAKGKAEGKAEAAIGMKAENIPIETIAKITGLSAQKIKAL